MAWDISAPPFGDRRILDNFQKHSYPIGIVVNLDGERFVDEGADYRNHTYAKYGREIMKQPQRAAVQIFDTKTIDMVRDEYRIREVTKAQADTIEGLAQELGIDVEGLARTVRDDKAEVLDLTDRPIPGLFAAGELVGGIFYGNYLGGAGLMSGAVFGRLAGRSAGLPVKSPQGGDRFRASGGSDAKRLHL